MAMHKSNSSFDLYCSSLFVSLYSSLRTHANAYTSKNSPLFVLFTRQRVHTPLTSYFQRQVSTYTWDYISFSR
jgi:hypothetical protein